MQKRARFAAASLAAALLICYSLAGLIQSAVEAERQGRLIADGAARVGGDHRIEMVLAPDEQRLICRQSERVCQWALDLGSGKTNRFPKS